MLGNRFSGLASAGNRSSYKSRQSTSTAVLPKSKIVSLLEGEYSFCNLKGFYVSKFEETTYLVQCDCWG
jgi:hypothetical protein